MIIQVCGTSSVDSFVASVNQRLGKMTEQVASHLIFTRARASSGVSG